MLAAPFGIRKPPTRRRENESQNSTCSQTTWGPWGWGSEIRLLVPTCTQQSCVPRKSNEPAFSLLFIRFCFSWSNELTCRPPRGGVSFTGEFSLRSSDKSCYVSTSARKASGRWCPAWTLSIWDSIGPARTRAHTHVHAHAQHVHTHINMLTTESQCQEALVATCVNAIYLQCTTFFSVLT